MLLHTLLVGRRSGSLAAWAIVAGCLAPGAAEAQSQPQRRCDAVYCYEEVCAAGSPDRNCRQVTTRKCYPVEKEQCSTQPVRKCQKVTTRECVKRATQECAKKVTNVCRPVRKTRVVTQRQCDNGSVIKVDPVEAGVDPNIVQPLACRDVYVRVPYTENVCVPKVTNECHPAYKDDCHDVTKDVCDNVPEKTCRKVMDRDCRDEVQEVCTQTPGRSQCETRRTPRPCAAGETWTPNGCARRRPAEAVPTPAPSSPAPAEPAPPRRAETPPAPPAQAAAPAQEQSRSLPAAVVSSAVAQLTALPAPLVMGGSAAVTGVPLLLLWRRLRRRQGEAATLARLGITVLAHPDPGTQSVMEVAQSGGPHMTIRARRGSYATRIEKD